MKNFTTLLILFIFAYGPSFGQSDTLRQIAQKMEQIDRDTTLLQVEKSADSVYNHPFDGGGYLKIWYDSTGIKKIEQVIGLSYGSVRTILYLEGKNPIYILDKEENFKWNPNLSAYDYQSPQIEVFSAEIFVLNWNKDDSIIHRTGQRNLSEGTCSNFEYEYLIEKARELIPE